MKVPVLVAYARRLHEKGRTLDPIARRQATLAIERSDNAAINAVFARLEAIDHGLVGASEAIEQTLRASGDPLTLVNTLPNGNGYSTFGQTEWSLRASTLFYRALANGCLLRAAGTSLLLDLMSHVETAERWGVGSAGFAGGPHLAFKGGWGPEPDGSYLVRQTAIIRAGARRYVLAVMAHPPGQRAESFSMGQTMLRRVAGWARRTIHTLPGRATNTCT
jgi:hypothetical protein